MPTQDDWKFMHLAIQLARKSRSEPTGVHPHVGAVVVANNGEILAQAWRGKTKLGEHAEYAALERSLRNRSAVGTTVYTTLEPCTTRNHPKIPCATRLVQHRVARVVIGMLDPNQNICGRGVRLLRAAGIATEFFPRELMEQVEAQNRNFVHDQEAREGRFISCALGKRGSPYDFVNFADSRTEDVTIVAQNLRTLLERADFLPHVRRLLARGCRVAFVLTTFEIISAMDAAAAVHFAHSVRQLRNFYLSLPGPQRKRLRIHFHRGAATLSAIVRDPDDPAHAALTFTPKWATDSEPENRLYCVVERGQHKAAFDKLYGAIPGFMQPDALQLKQMCEKLEIPWRGEKSARR